MFEMLKADVPMRLPAESGDTLAKAASTRGWLPFNVNYYVRVRLTSVGLAELHRQDDELYACMPAAAAARRPDPDTLYRPDADGFVSFQAWMLISML